MAKTKKKSGAVSSEIKGIIGHYIKQFADQLFDQLKVVFKLKLKDTRDIIIRSLVLCVFFIVAVVAILAGILTMIYALIDFLLTLLPFIVPPGAKLFVFGLVVVIVGYICMKVTDKKIEEV